MKTIEQLREETRQELDALHKLEQAGYTCQGWNSNTHKVTFTRYAAGENPATTFPEYRGEFKDARHAAQALGV